MSTLIARFKISFSHDQFMVYDASVAEPECAWSAMHASQGFVRRTSTVCFRTLLDFGYALIIIYSGSYINSREHERVIKVPFFSPTGSIIVEGPEKDVETQSIRIEPGYYELCAAQQVSGEDDEIIELFFQKTAETEGHSEVILADDDLAPPELLLEDEGMNRDHMSDYT
jgi:hypothetical protein